MNKSRTHTPLFAWLVDHSRLTFIVMSISFISFGVISINLTSYVAANANYIATYRWMALVDGGLEQFLELWLKAFAALGSYLLFKLCEHALIERIAHYSHDDHHQAPTAETGVDNPDRSE